MNSSNIDASPEPFAADAFLTALRDVNSTFEGMNNISFLEVSLLVFSMLYNFNELKANFLNNTYKNLLFYM